MIQIKHRKGISTFIATLLLMVLAVAAGIVIYAYVMGYLGGFGGTNNLGSLSIDTSQATLTGGIVAYIRNIGKTSVTLDKVYVNGIQASGTLAFSPSPLPQNQVGSVTISWTSVGITYAAGTTYTVKLICLDNTQLSFDVKGS